MLAGYGFATVAASSVTATSLGETIYGSGELAMDAAEVQAIAAIGGMMVALIGLIIGLMFWLVRNLERNLMDRIDRVERNLIDRIDRVERDLGDRIDRVERDLGDGIDRVEQKVEGNHTEILTLLQNHTHGPDDRPVFHRLTDAAEE